jgi:predicted short-subunit dehydrogenase-like oxidoreductase (DUF2520 family)
MTDDLLRSPVAIIGPGRLGTALAHALFHRGVPIRAVVGPSENKASRLALDVACETAVGSIEEIPADVEVVLICTPDDAIPSVARAVATVQLPFERLFAAHFSGALTSEVLAPIHERGARVASIHPVQSFAGGDNDWQQLAGIYYGIEAEAEALPKADRFVRLLGGIPVTIPREAKPAYHLACALASNFTVALVQAAAALLDEVGLAEKDATRFLLPLVEGTVRNVRQLGVTGAITGPIARGDTQTVKAHLDLLRRHNSELQQVYRALGKVAMALGRQRGSFDESKLDQMQKLLNGEIEE